MRAGNTVAMLLSQLHLPFLGYNHPSFICRHFTVREFVRESVHGSPRHAVVVCLIHPGTVLIVLQLLEKSKSLIR